MERDRHCTSTSLAQVKINKNQGVLRLASCIFCVSALGVCWEVPAGDLSRPLPIPLATHGVRDWGAGCAREGEGDVSWGTEISWDYLGLSYAQKMQWFCGSLCLLMRIFLGSWWCCLCLMLLMLLF